MGADMYFNPPKEPTAQLWERVKHMQEERDALVRKNVKLSKELQKAYRKITRLENAIATIEDIRNG